MFRASFIAFRRVLRRPATWLLVWSSRHVLALWGRSILNELRRPARFDRDRFMALLKGLWSETAATGFTAKPATRMVTILDDGTPDSLFTFAEGVHEPRREIHLDPQPA
jgi:hypothetical protein